MTEISQDAVQVRVVHLDRAGLAALAAGDAKAAATAIPVPVTAYAVGPAWRSTWQRRLQQVQADPSVAGWVTGLVWDPEERVVVGRAGFHDRPDARGMVEVGYAVDPAFRRRGYGGASLRQLLARAAAEPAVVTVRASVAPGNVASTRLVLAAGFRCVGEQWDDEGGRELLYERPARDAEPHPPLGALDSDRRADAPAVGGPPPDPRRAPHQRRRDGG